MIVTYRDELGIVSVPMNDTFGLQFDGDKAYFTDTDGKDYNLPISQLVSVAKDDWYSAE
jgi:hypothetical protein